MKIPRQVTGSQLAQALRVLGDVETRQTRSHIRLKTETGGTHHVTVPNHYPLKVGTLLNGVLKPVAAQHRLTVEQLLAKLDLEARPFFLLAAHARRRPQTPALAFPAARTHRRKTAVPASPQ